MHDYFLGKMCDLRIYNRALNRSEISKICKSSEKSNFTSSAEMSRHAPTAANPTVEVEDYSATGSKN